MDPTKWTIDQVMDWLSEKGLGEYVKNFRGMINKSNLPFVE